MTEDNSISYDDNLDSDLESTSSNETTPTNGPKARNVVLDLLDDTESESSIAEPVSIDKHETLLCAARNGIVDLAQQLINAREIHNISLDLDCKGKTKRNLGWTPLQLASYFGHYDMVKLLLDNGANVNCVNRDGDTSLHKAAFIGNTDLVVLLIQHNADVNIINGEGRTPRDVAKTREIADMILAAELAERINKETQLLDAAKEGNLLLLNQLLKEENPPNILSVDAQGNTCLHCAAYRGHKEVAVLLLQNGIDTTVKNNRGQTAQDLARDQQMQQVLSVKPIQQLQKMATRFEGQLLKLSRFLGWKLVWVVLERGVLTYFNNRADASSGVKRKDFKYLDGARITPLVTDSASFLVQFSDSTIHKLSVVNDGQVSGWIKEDLHDLLEGAFIDITNENSEDDSDFQSTFNATESVISIPGESHDQKIDTQQFQNCVNILKNTIESIRLSTVKVQRIPTDTSVQYPSTTSSRLNSGTTMCSSGKKSSTSEDDTTSYYAQTFTVYNSHRSDTVRTYSTNIKSPITSESESDSFFKVLQTGQWNEGEYESNGNLYVDTPQSITTPTYDGSSTREYYDEGISHSNVDSPLSDSKTQLNQIMQNLMKPRRRYWSTQHVSSLTPLKEIDSVPVESDGDVEQQLIDEYNEMEIADTKQLALMYQARVRDCEKLARRVAELEETLDTELKQKDAVIHKKEIELNSATMTFSINKGLLVEAQQKVKEYKGIVDELTNDRDFIKTEKTKLENELEKTRKELVESDRNHIYTKSKITEDHKAEIHKINSRHKEEIETIEQLINDQTSKLHDLQRQVTDLTHVNDSQKANQYDLTKRLNTIMSELSAERENLLRANEEAMKMKDVVFERDYLKRQVKDLEEKLNELLREIAKIEKDKLSSKHDRCHQTHETSLPSNSIETELKRSLESLRVKRDEITQMKQIISEQQQMITMLTSAQNSQGISTECQTSEESTNLRNQGEQTDLHSYDILEYKAQIAILEQDISQKDVELNRYRQKLQKLENDIDELKRNDTTQFNDYNRLHHDYEKLAMDYQKRGETIHNLQQNLGSLRSDFISLAENSILQQSPSKQDNTDIEDPNNYQQLIDTIRTELQIMSNKNKNIKASLLEKSNDIVQMSEENQQLQRRIMELETGKDQHDKCHEEITALRNSLSIRNQNSEAFQTVIENLKIKLREAEERLMHVCDLENANKSLRKQLKRNNDNYDSIRNEIHSMRNSLMKFVGEQLNDMEESFDFSDKEQSVLRQLASLRHNYEKTIESKSQVIEVQLLEIEKYKNFDQEVREAIETQINVLKTNCEEKMANAQIQCYRVLKDAEDTPQTAPPETISRDTTTVNRVYELVTQLSRIKLERDKYVQATGMIDELMYRIQNFEIQNAQLISELEHANQDLEISKQRINTLQNHEITIVMLQKQIKQLESVIKQFHTNKPNYPYGGGSEIKELQQQLVSIQSMHTQDIETLHNSLKDVMKQEIETIQSQFHKKIISLESEKAYLENCLRSVQENLKEMVQKFHQEKANLNVIIESNVSKLNEMSSKMGSFDQREMDWKEKEAALMKEKRTLTKGLDKFAKAMLELYIKHKHLTGEVKRMKEEKHSCFEYAHCLKKKLNQMKDQASGPGAAGATTSTQTRIRRSLSESSTPLNTTALQVNQQIMKKSSSIQHSSRATKKTGAKLPISSVKLKINNKVAHHKRAATARINTSSFHMQSSSSLDAPQVVEAYRNRNRLRKSSTSKE